MNWPGPLIQGRFIKRYKRFFADVRLDDGSVVTAHCPNTGSMKTCQAADVPVWITHHDDPKRKLKYSWQAVRMPDGWVGINTGLANKLVEEAVGNQVIRELQGYSSLKREKKYGDRSRIDCLLQAPDRPDCYVEVKNVTLLIDNGRVAFPDAVTSRGAKHLDELVQVAASGQRAVLCFCVQRESALEVWPADDYDPVYADKLRRAVAQGVEVIAYQAVFDQQTVRLDARLPVILD